MKNKKAVESFADEAGTLLYGLATVPDDWMSQLKTYHKIEVTDNDTAVMWLTTLALYVELLVARTNDLLDQEESELLEDKCIKKIVNLIKLVDFYGKRDANEAEKEILNVLRETIKSSREKEREHNETIAKIYLYSFIKSFGNKMPEQIITNYINAKIELFEKQNLRNKI